MEADPLPERAFVRPKTFREQFVDDGDAWRGLVVGFVEVASLFQRNSKRGKITGAGRPNLGAVFGVRRRGLAIDFETVAPIVSAEREVGDHAGGINTRQRTHRRERIAIKSDHARGIGVTVLH